MTEVNKFQAAGKTKTVKGTILNPEMSGLRFILNFVNMAGKAEGPLYPIFDKKWVRVKQDVKGWYATKTGAYKLGAINSTATQSDVWVVNCLCQDAQLKVDEAGLQKCLKEVYKLAREERASIHISNLLAPMCPSLTTLVASELISKGLTVYFYDE